jgi:hypothetical protein
MLGGAEIGPMPTPVTAAASVPVSSDGLRVVTADRATGALMAATLATGWSVRAPQVAVDDASEIAVVWETHRLVGGDCKRCSPRTVSEGVFVALGRFDEGFGAPVRLAGPRTGSPGGGDFQLANPSLVMDAQGRAVVAGSDASGTWVASRDPLGSFSAPERAATDFTVTGTALGRGGEVLLTDARSRVVTRPPGGAFTSPIELPAAAAGTPYGLPALVAANGAGDAVALYGFSPVLASRRTPDGLWPPPTVLTTVRGASGQAVAVAGDGTAVATFAQTERDPREGGHTALMATTLRPDGTAATAQVNAAGSDGDMRAGDLDADATGRFALAFGQGPVAIASGDALVTLRSPGGDFGPPALLASGRFLLGNFARAALDADGALAT